MIEINVSLLANACDQAEECLCIRGFQIFFSCRDMLKMCKYLILSSKVDAYITNLQGLFFSFFFFLAEILI